MRYRVSVVYVFISIAANLCNALDIFPIYIYSFIFLSFGVGSGGTACNVISTLIGSHFLHVENLNSTFREMDSGDFACFLNLSLFEVKVTPQTDSICTIIRDYAK